MSCQFQTSVCVCFQHSGLAKAIDGHQYVAACQSLKLANLAKRAIHVDLRNEEYVCLANVIDAYCSNF